MEWISDPPSEVDRSKDLIFAPKMCLNLSNTSQKGSLNQVLIGTKWPIDPPNQVISQTDNVSYIHVFGFLHNSFI